MLQQTQVERVLPFYARFMKRFPHAKTLSLAPLSEVLKVWQGLGYNRRAKMLHAAAKKLAVTKLDSITELEKLPGVGRYTARAIAAFAFNKDAIVVETNIRTAIVHHFFPKRRKVSDAEIERVLEKTLPRGRAREWYSALMDYGAYLKRSGVSHNARSEHYARQSKFSGSLREARGAIVRELTQGTVSRARLVMLLGTTRRKQVALALDALCAEGLVRVRRSRYALAD
ncbi:MAG: A/G-specific adenine glycosylase [Patescibacteria group bacterium]|nr:A/G-specific adenine glycosylase [Patescibacteria group bacterium]